jgi:hypothetical protein
MTTAKPRPHVWITGPDPVLHKQYRAYSQQRNQALWRGEVWNLEFADFVLAWGDLWHTRGRLADSNCMIRTDLSQPWSPGNIEIVSRGDHSRSGAGSRYHSGLSSNRTPKCTP